MSKEIRNVSETSMKYGHHNYTYNDTLILNSIFFFNYSAKHLQIKALNKNSDINHAERIVN